jgi:uncharacterized protein YdbL (DUF1318 family)
MSNIIIAVLAVAVLLVFIDRQSGKDEAEGMTVLSRTSKDQTTCLSLETSSGKIVEACTLNGYTYYIDGKAVSENIHKEIHAARRKKWSTTVEGE